MSVRKRALALMIACLLLVTAIFVGTTQVVATEGPDQLPAQVFDFAGAQVSTDVDGNYALRFGFNLGCTGVIQDENYNAVIGQDAKVCIDGQSYPLVGFGANVALDYDAAAAQHGSCVPAKKLYSINDDGTITYTARVTSLTAEDLDTDIYVMAYVLYRDGDEIKTYTTDVFSSSYRKTFFAANSPKVGDVVHEHLILGEVTVDLETNTGTMVVKNVSKWYVTDQDTFHLLFTCYDKDNESLGDVRIDTGCIRYGMESDPLPFTLPEGTYSMEFKAANGDFYIDRAAFFAANSPKAGDVVHEYLTLGEVTVDLETNTGTMVVKNVSKGLETDQLLSHLLFTCYNKDGQSLGDVRINIGRINAGRESAPLSFTLPNGTYSMRLKAANIETWTDGWH